MLVDIRCILKDVSINESGIDEYRSYLHYPLLFVLINEDHRPPYRSANSACCSSPFLVLIESVHSIQWRAVLRATTMCCLRSSRISSAFVPSTWILLTWIDVGAADGLDHNWFASRIRLAIGSIVFAYLGPRRSIQKAAIPEHVRTHQDMTVVVEPATPPAGQITRSCVHPMSRLI